MTTPPLAEGESAFSNFAVFGGVVRLIEPACLVMKVGRTEYALLLPAGTYVEDEVVYLSGDVSQQRRLGETWEVVGGEASRAQIEFYLADGEVIDYCPEGLSFIDAGEHPCDFQRTCLV